MNAADYSAWLDVSGLYLGNYSHAERYQTFEKKISPEGLNVRIVFDFLQNNRDGVNVADWRNHCVYEMDGGLPYRIDRTAAALAAVGAPHAAEAVRTVQSTNPATFLTQGFAAKGKKFDLASMMADMQRGMMAAQAQQPSMRNVETRDEIASLLRNYVEAHKTALQADMDRHGDVRQVPGYDPEARRRELESIQRKKQDREEQVESVAKMRSLMEQVESRLEKFGDHSSKKMRSCRRDLLEARREYADRPSEDLIPEMRTWLGEFETFANRHANVFFPSPVENPALLARLQNLGAYEFDVREWGAELSWNVPVGFDCDWPRVKVAIQYPDKNEEALSETLDVVDGLRSDFASIAARLRAEALSGFHDFVLGIGGLDRLSEWMEIARDENGEVSEAEILRMAGDASLNVESMRQYGEGATVVAWFPAEWDEEHGLEVPLVGEGGGLDADDDDEEGDDAF